jgi:hypothetical protein
MSTATNVTYLQYGSSWDAKPFNKGWMRVRGTATFPAGVNTCTITNIPNFAGDSEVLIAQMGVSGATGKFIHVSSGTVHGNVGTITIQAENTTTVTTPTPFMFQIIQY